MSARASSFYWPMRLLPPAKRRAMFALYGFCHAVDDIADGDGDRDTRRARLAVLRAALDTWSQTGIALHPAVAALAPAIAAHALPLSELHLLLDGMESDVNTPLTAPDSQALRLYCRQVAGTVGVLATRIMGRTDADSFALALAEALQLTNILRDLTEDSERSRLYLPEDSLRAAGMVPPYGPRAVLSHPALAQACRHVAAQAEARFAEAEAELRRVGRARLWPALAMMAIYRHLLARLRRRDCWTAPPPRLGHWRKLILALGAVARCGFG